MDLEKYQRSQILTVAKIAELAERFDDVAKVLFRPTRAYPYVTSGLRSSLTARCISNEGDETIVDPREERRRFRTGGARSVHCWF